MITVLSQPRLAAAAAATLLMDKSSPDIPAFSGGNVIAAKESVKMLTNYSPIMIRLLLLLAREEILFDYI